MTTTKAAGVGMQILSIPLVALGLVLTLMLVLSITQNNGLTEDASMLAIIALSLDLIGGWLLVRGKRAARGAQQ